MTKNIGEDPTKHMILLKWRLISKMDMFRNNIPVSFVLSMDEVSPRHPNAAVVNQLCLKSQKARMEAQVSVFRHHRP